MTIQSKKPKRTASIQTDVIIIPLTTSLARQAVTLIWVVRRSVGKLRMLWEQNSAISNCVKLAEGRFWHKGE